MPYDRNTDCAPDDNARTPWRLDAAAARAGRGDAGDHPRAVPIVVAVFALLMQWVKPTEDTVRIFNQLLKVVSVAIGTYIAVGRGQEGGLLRGSLIGLLYMALGVAAYALLSGQGAPWTAYLADLAMGTATGGIIGAIVSNISGK